MKKIITVTLCIVLVLLIDFIILYSTLKVQRAFVKLVGWEQLTTQGVPRWQVHKRVAGGSQRRGSSM